MSEVAEKTAEVVAENVEEAIDGMVNVVEVVRNNPVILTGVGVFGLAVGLGGGYFFAKKRLQSKFEDELTEATQEAREYYASLHKLNPDGSQMTPKQLLDELHPGLSGLASDAEEAVEEYRGEEPSQTQLDVEERLISQRQEEATQRVFEKRGGPPAEEMFVYEVEVALRGDTDPYIVTHDEFYENEWEAEQISYVYYEEDDTVSDENDVAMIPHEMNSRIGEDHLVKFGWGSKDVNTVYIHNPRLNLLFEVTKSPGSYTKEVLAFKTDEPDTLSHSHKRGQSRRLRDD